jgi:hypothetical protein
MNAVNSYKVAAANVTGTIYLGRASKRDPRVFTNKREAEPEVMKAVVDRMQHGHSEPAKVAKTLTFDGKQWWRLTVEPADPPADAGEPSCCTRTREEERERCARIAEYHAYYPEQKHKGAELYSRLYAAAERATRIAAAIRSTGDTP